MTLGYHTSPIPKGTLGAPSKITEEYFEFFDAIAQGSKVMALVELSDLIGAIESYVATFNLTLEDLKKFSDITRRAFESGERT